MQKIILTEEQAHRFTNRLEPIEIVDPNGNLLQRVEPPITPEFIAECKRRAASPGPWYSGEEVRQHLLGLEEAWEREGPFDEKRMRELLEELRAKGKKYQQTR